MAKKHLLVSVLLYLVTFLCVGFSSIREQVISVAKSQIGIIESSENRGKQIDIYIEHCGVEPPIPWCGAYCKFVMDSCWIESPNNPQVAASWFTQNVIENPVEACNAGFYFPKLHGIHHVGFVEDYTDEDVIVIAGNTNDKNIREGDKVMQKRYPITQNLFFSDWVKERQSTYTVKPQDTVFHISQLFGVPIEVLVEKNHLDGYRISVGQTLLL